MSNENEAERLRRRIHEIQRRGDRTAADLRRQVKKLTAEVAWLRSERERLTQRVCRAETGYVPARTATLTLAE